LSIVSSKPDVSAVEGLQCPTQFSPTDDDVDFDNGNNIGIVGIDDIDVLLDTFNAVRRFRSPSASTQLRLIPA
jgi:hypothetical protein